MDREFVQQMALFWGLVPSPCSPGTRRIITADLGFRGIGTVDDDMEFFADPILGVSPLKRKID